VSVDHVRPLRIVVLTERRLLAEMVRLTLNHGVFVTRHVSTIDEALATIGEWRPHLLVVEMESDGEQLIRRIGRNRPGSGSRIPVLALTRRGDLKTKLAAFELGVDDIMTIPISPEELLARVLAITRRSSGQDIPLIPVLRLGDLEIDILNRHVRSGTSELHLTGVEQSLLYLLAASAGEVVTRDEILDALWGSDYVAESNVVDRHIRSLRAKLQNGWRNPRFIATVPGRGYRFIPLAPDSVAIH
jgi:DNA-binding response OmpR family regulator